MEAMKFVIPRQTKGIQSVRLGNGFHYQPKSDKDYKALISVIALNTMKEQGWTRLDCPVFMQIIDIRQLPSSRKKSERNAVESGMLLMRGSRPDWDNIGKGIGDALNGIAYADDMLTCDGLVHKRWGRENEVIILLRPAQNTTLYDLLKLGGFA